MNFAGFLKEKRQERGQTLRGLAEEIGIAPSYLSDIEKEKRNAPTLDILEKIIKVLELTEEEINLFNDLAAKNKNQIANDITDYVANNQNVRVALRKAKELNFSDSEWLKIIEEMERK